MLKFSNFKELLRILDSNYRSIDIFDLLDMKELSYITVQSIKCSKDILKDKLCCAIRRRKTKLFFIKLLGKPNSNTFVNCHHHAIKSLKS